MKNKIFERIGKLGDISMSPRHKSREDICRDVDSFVNSMRDQFKGRYLDTECLENVLPFFDFEAFFLEEKSKGRGGYLSWLTEKPRE